MNEEAQAIKEHLITVWWKVLPYKAGGLSLILMSWLLSLGGSFWLGTMSFLSGLGGVVLIVIAGTKFFYEWENVGEKKRTW